VIQYQVAESVHLVGSVGCSCKVAESQAALTALLRFIEKSLKPLELNANDHDSWMQGRSVIPPKVNEFGRHVAVLAREREKASLPTCTSTLKAQQAVVSDATSPTHLGMYTSGGAVVSPVVCDGSNWVSY
jgi:hypothetical protein